MAITAFLCMLLWCVICHVLCRQTAFGALQAWPGGLQLGGGVTTDNAMQYLDAGASHVIVTSFVFREGRLEEQRLADLVRMVLPG
jgi:phosphoribosylformimino-5-aminoimidazole carboxamide ribotide isomerase